MHQEIAGHKPNRCRRQLRRAVLAAAALIAVVAVSGCSSSPKEELIESADKECETITNRFAEDLAYGETIGADDMKNVRQRIALIEELQNHVKGMPPPESAADRAQLRVWLDKLDAYADALNTMHNLYEDYQPGWDMLIVLAAGEVEDRAKDAGSAAKKFGFDTCARTERWEYLSPD